MKRPPYQLEGSDLIDRARKLRLPDAKIYGDKKSLTEIFNTNPVALDELRKQVVEQERWNRDRHLVAYGLVAALASALSALAAWAAVLWIKHG